MVCLGTYKLEKDYLVDGLQNGFRFLDTAKAYENEGLIGQVIKESGILHEDVKIITKLARPHLENINDAIHDSVKKLGKIPEFILIHAPYPDVDLVLRARELESLKSKGEIKGWGVSNFDIKHLEALIENGLIPELNQVEFHPFFQRMDLVNYCSKFKIIFQAYRPLVKGKALENASLLKIAKGHKISVPILIHSWLSQLNIQMVTKASTNLHQREYVDVKPIRLSNAEMEVISLLDEGEKGRTSIKGGWFVS